MSEASPDVVTLRYEQDLAFITLNALQRMNAFGQAMREALYDCLLDVEKNMACRCIVLSGAGGNFTAGGDINEMRQRTLLEGRQKVDILVRIFKKLLTIAQPIVCAVEGNCMGAGVSFAAASDYVVASSSARFGVAQVKVGLLPDLGAIWSLPRKVGYRKAMELAAFGDRFEAEEALRIGLVNRLCEPGRALEEAMVAARRFAQNPPVAMALIKAALNSGNETLEQAIKTETDYQAILYSTEDHGEAARAFLEKRKPQFTGR